MCQVFVLCDSQNWPQNQINWATVRYMTYNKMLCSLSHQMNNGFMGTTWFFLSHFSGPGRGAYNRHIFHENGRRPCFACMYFHRFSTDLRPKDCTQVPYTCTADRRHYTCLRYSVHRNNRRPNTRRRETIHWYMWDRINGTVDRIRDRIPVDGRPYTCWWENLYT